MPPLEVTPGQELHDELVLVGTAVGFGLAILVESGKDPIDVELEPDLVNFNENTTNPLTALAFILLRGYKRSISPLLPKNCRYVPTCSEYAAIALKEYGIVRGGLLTAWRVARCNPLGKTGYDQCRNQIYISILPDLILYFLTVVSCVRS